MMTEAKAAERLKRIARLKSQIDKAGGGAPTSILRRILDRDYQALNPADIPLHIWARHEEGS
ncbi:hypothetical protein [Roseivivax halodurans]|uniref:hypothetical protein n=1 Tax=Roseivivax halodurans TaxID=93683 RepID=UPI0012FBDDF5|nr:hypothetical protein [Roseivivax halodurans]